MPITNEETMKRPTNKTKNKMKTETNEIEINGVKYIPKSSVKQTAMADPSKGLKLVLIRSYASGVHVGYLKSRKDLLAGLSVTLVQTRRIWYWDGACSLSQLATDGIASGSESKCKFSVTIPAIEVTQVVEIIPVAAKAEQSIKSIPEWKK